MTAYSDSMFPPEQQLRAEKRTHRAGKGRKKNPMKDANSHIQRAHDDPTPAGTTAHLFKALSALKKALKEAPPETA